MMVSGHPVSLDGLRGPMMAVWATRDETLRMENTCSHESPDADRLQT